MRLNARLLLSIPALLLLSCASDPGLTLPGRLEDGRVRLPNGWLLSPAGAQVDVGELPLNMAASPDGRTLVTTDNGTGAQGLTVIDLAAMQRAQTVPMPRAWLGLRFAADGRRVYASGGNENRVYAYDLAGGRIELADSLVLGLPWPKQKIWPAGLDIDEAAGRLYVVARENDSLYVVDLRTKALVKRMKLPATPYTCVLSRDGKRLYVSLWGGAAVAVVGTGRLDIRATIPVGDHPCDMREAPDGTRLFVANANNNTVYVIDVAGQRVTESLVTSLRPDAPAGSTPNALALTPDGKTLYVANADNNYLALFDVTEAGSSRPLGFIPTGWYPTAVCALPDGRIAVANGKGLASRPNPRGPDPTTRTSEPEYIGELFSGTVAVIDPPDAARLAEYTAQVYANSLYDRTMEFPREAGHPVPAGAGGESPINHVFYVIKENRTYDQMFGDIPGGNGDPSLCIFPDSVTPNHHALAREFVLLDNFYVDAEVSADGHNWSMGAYATDYVEKSWPTNYGGRGGTYDFEGGKAISSPSAGYIWDNCLRNGVSYRSYGEFAENAKKPGDSARATVPALQGHVAPFFRGWDMRYSDVDRVKDWMKEFDLYERDGGLPQFQVIRLPNDHTEGTRKGSLTPTAYLAQNDQALGMLVERIAKSRYWKESVIFVLEDDAQDGADHVDAHRSIALVISPWAKRRAVDSEMYSTSGLLRTMELILGLPPMSQFDAAATPMYGCFTAVPDYAPYKARPAQVDMFRKNPDGAYGQLRMEELDLSKEDAIPDREFSDIIWRSVRGADHPMPPPVRSAFVMIDD